MTTITTMTMITTAPEVQATPSDLTGSSAALPRGSGRKVAFAGNRDDDFGINTTTCLSAR
jgi:hypothetical protein